MRCSATPEGFTFYKKLERGRERRKAALAEPRRAVRRLGHRRGTGARHDPGRRHPDPADRRGRRAGHVQPPARGVPRRRDRHSTSCRCRTSRRRGRRSRSTTARSPRTPPSASSSATTFRSRAASSIWEAQYGDFINGAQVMLDQFVTSGRAKWGLQPSLVFLLPHGYEGQGPEHSSARPERFLQAAADINLRLVNCTTAAQYFHLLRRQAALLRRDPLPLFVLTPKSLLRHPAVASSPRELEEGRFQSVIDDAEARGRASKHQATRAVQRQGLRRSDRQRAARRGDGRGHLPRRAALSVPQRRAARAARRLSVARATSSGCRKSRRTWARGSSCGRCSRS